MFLVGLKINYYPKFLLMLFQKSKWLEVMADIYVTLRDSFPTICNHSWEDIILRFIDLRHRTTLLSRFIGARRQLLAALLLGHPQHSSAINSRGKAARLYVRVARCSYMPSARARGPGTCCQLIITAAAACYIDTSDFHDEDHKLPRSDIVVSPIIIRTCVFYESLPEAISYIICIFFLNIAAKTKYHIVYRHLMYWRV